MDAPARGLPATGLGKDADESELLAALLPALHRLAKDQIRPLEIDRDHQIPTAVLSQLAELGFFGLSIPEAYGGAGLSLHGVCSAVTALARYDRSVATTVGLQLGLGTRGLVAFGSEELKQALLPGLAAGHKIAAFAATEAGAGSDLAALRMTGREVSPGLLRVDGGKIYVTNGGLAHVFTVLAATPGLGGARRGHSLLAVLRSDPGVTAAGEEVKLGLRGSSTTSLHLDGAELPLGRVLGTAGRGMEHAAHVLAWGRTAMAAGCVGAAQAALELTSAHVTTRKQFGKPLAAQEVVRAQLADAAALAFAMQALVRSVGAVEAQPAELAARSTAAKVFCSESDWEICDLAVQLHGGAGFIEETGVSLLLRDARVTRIFEGANDVLLTAHGAGAMSAGSAPRAALEPAAPPALRAAAALADGLAAQISGLHGELSARLGLRLLTQPRQLHRLGRLGVLREAADAALAYAAATGTPGDQALAVHFVDLARRRAAPFFAELPLLEQLDAAASTLLPRSEP
jgi:alkylation response protein AidB-like acyl-CoA dehydrogenase